jgi:Ca2+-binding EF-hand superfamily protein
MPFRMPDTTAVADDIERVRGLRDLFNRLDKNRDGKIEFDELKQVLQEFEAETKADGKTFRINNRDENARVLFDKMRREANSDDQSGLSFRDFVDYISQTDKQIELIFCDLDVDKNGIIEASEIKQAFAKLNIVLNDKDVDKLISHIDTNKSLRIDWNEWRGTCIAIPLVLGVASFLFLFFSFQISSVLHHMTESNRCYNIGDAKHLLITVISRCQMTTRKKKSKRACGGAIWWLVPYLVSYLELVRHHWTGNKTKYLFPKRFHASHIIFNDDIFIKF